LRGLAGRIEQNSTQGSRRLARRGEEATLGATAARQRPVRPPRTICESRITRPNPKKNLPQAFEIIEGFHAALALVKGLAGGGTKLAQHLGMGGTALRAFDGGAFGKKGIFVHGTADGWRYAVG